jgi:mRNA-degrading endonuclease RelE of RelBE toxin-antitoxin system
LGYLVLITKSVEREDLPKLQKSGVNLKPLQNIFKKLQSNPYITSKSKTGDLQSHRAVNWNNGYRVLFKIDEEKKQVIIVAIDSHDNAYKKAKKRNN